jgi:hypothetical protein
MERKYQPGRSLFSIICFLDLRPTGLEKALLAGEAGTTVALEAGGTTVLGLEAEAGFLVVAVTGMVRW